MRTHYYGPKDKKKTHKIDVYDSYFTLILSHSISKAYQKFTGEKWEEREPAGLALFKDGDYAIILKRDQLTHNTIAHEVFHVAHRLMDDTGSRLSGKTKEAYAYLAGYIAELVYNDLKSWKTKVR